VSEAAPIFEAVHRTMTMHRLHPVVDDFTREYLALIVDTSISGRRVARELDTIIATRKKPLMVVSDDGTELTSHANLRWQQERVVGWLCIAPGPAGRERFCRELQWPLSR